LDSILLVTMQRPEQTDYTWYSYVSLTSLCMAVMMSDGLDVVNEITM